MIEYFDKCRCQHLFERLCNYGSKYIYAGSALNVCLDCGNNLFQNLSVFNLGNLSGQPCLRNSSLCVRFLYGIGDGFKQAKCLSTEFFYIRLCNSRCRFIFRFRFVGNPISCAYFASSVSTAWLKPFLMTT